MVCTVPHTDTRRFTVTDKDVLDAIAESGLPDDWDIVEQTIQVTHRRWFRKPVYETKLRYNLLNHIRLGIFPWQIIMAVNTKNDLLCWLYGYGTGHDDAARNMSPIAKDSNDA